MNEDIKELFKILGILGSAILVGLGIKKAVDYYNDIEKVEEKTKNKLNDLGISQEILETIDPYDSNEFVKSLFVAVSKNPNFDIDTITVDYDKSFWKNSIHVVSTTVVDKRDQLRKRFTLYFSIPDFTDRKKDLPGLGTFIGGFNNILEQLQDNIIKNKNIWAKKDLVGLVTYKIFDKVKNSVIIKVAELDDPEAYENFKGNDDNGLSNFYRLYKDNKRKDTDQSKKWIKNIENDILEIILDEEEDEEILKTAQVIDFSLAYKASYNIDSINCPGISWEMALNSLKYLVDNLEFNHKSCLDRDDFNPIRYDHLMFHSLDVNNNPELHGFYELEGDRIRELVFEC